MAMTGWPYSASISATVFMSALRVEEPRHQPEQVVGRGVLPTLFAGDDNEGVTGGLGSPVDVLEADVGDELQPFSVRVVGEVRAILDPARLTQHPLTLAVHLHEHQLQVNQHAAQDRRVRDTADVALGNACLLLV